MGDKIDRRAAKTAWRERKADWAVVALRIGGRTWLKLTPEPEAFGNRMRFMLRQGGGAGLAPGMAEAWRQAGAVEIDVLERLDPALPEISRERVGAARLDHWQGVLGAALV
jgi:hypothetical protein